MKKCSKCLRSKSLSSFSKREASKDGLQHRCKECQAKFLQERYPKVAEKRRQEAQEYRKRNGIPKLPRNDKTRARELVSTHLKRGKIKKEPCEKCGSKVRIQAHHEDYLKPLDVNWLCSKCHAVKHRIYD